MRRIDGDGFGIGRFFQGIFGAERPKLRLSRDETMPAPPEGQMWHRRSAQDEYTLCDLVRRPTLEVGDVFGINPNDPIPLAPNGTELTRLYNPGSAEGVKGAAIFRVDGPEVVTAQLGLPRGHFGATAAIQAIGQAWFPPADEGQRWITLGVNGRNPSERYAVQVAA